MSTHERHRGQLATAAVTQVRGLDEHDDLDGVVPDDKAYHPRRFPRAPTTAELRARGFVSNPVSTRCWCGRPQLDATKRCKLDHEWPRQD